MIEDGAVLHGKAINEALEVMLRVLVEQTKRHGVKLLIESDDAQIKAFFGGRVVFGMRFSATAEGGQHNGERQNCHCDEVFLHILWFYCFVLIINNELKHDKLYLQLKTFNS